MKELNLIHSMWKQDCIIGSKLDEASQQTPVLHSKYLHLLSEAKAKHKRLELEQKILLKDKFNYYNGKMSREDITSRGWVYDPFDGLKVLKSDMEHYYDSDHDIQKSIEEIEYWKIIIQTLTDILDNIKWRHQTISNIIKWKQFEAGN